MARRVEAASVDRAQWSLPTAAGAGLMGGARVLQTPAHAGNRSVPLSPLSHVSHRDTILSGTGVLQA